MARKSHFFWVHACNYLTGSMLLGKRQQCRNLGIKREVIKLSNLEEKDNVAYLKVLFTSALPVLELRGGLPLGIYLGLSLWEAFLFSFLGNVMIIYPVLKLLERLEVFLAQNKVTAPLYRMMIKKVSKKKDLFIKYGKYGLFLFVAVPLPTTGAWTACIAARFFRIPTREAFGAIALGVLAAGLFVLFNSYLLVDVIN